MAMVKQGRTSEARAGQKLVIGPWRHGNTTATKIGDLEFGPDARLDLQALQLRWMDARLKSIDNGFLQEPPVRIFVMGANRWRAEREWPLARAQYIKYYLHSDGRANTAAGGGTLDRRPPGQEPADTFEYDPANPVPTRGGNLLGAPAPAGPFDQREVEKRPDVLVFSTPPLDADLEVTGPVTVTLFAASTARDTDFTAKLVDVHPDGAAYNLVDGIVRARYRESSAAPALIDPGVVYSYPIDLWSTSNVFKKGHRIRIEISSSNFPRFDRNPNTGGTFGTDTTLVKATQTIHHDARRPSHITLPIIPSEPTSDSGQAAR
jgi:putative CocE/NonD family hydrolase